MLPFFWVKTMFRILSIFLMMLSQAAMAEIPTGQRSVFFESAAGERFELGKIDIRQNGNAYDYDLMLNDSKFSDQFLSMRPFKCIDGDVMVCRLEYPYDKGTQISSNDMGDLEYEFLFIVRSPTEYGIDPYNGRYFVFNEQNGRLVGEVNAVDLNILAAPPQAGVKRPITEADLDYIEADNERFARVAIE